MYVNFVTNYALFRVDHYKITDVYANFTEIWTKLDLHICCFSTHSLDQFIISPPQLSSDQ